MSEEKRILAEILELTYSITPDNIGDVYVKAANLYARISSENNRELGEDYVSKIRSLARKADVGWKLFGVPPKPSNKLSEEEYIQIATLISNLHGFCYGVERLDEASFVTGPNSPPVRFYINSLYHYISALFLLDREDNEMGGTVYKTLVPMGLSKLLTPIRHILDLPMGDGISFGETIRRIRNKFLVHGTFSPSDIANVVKQTHLREMDQRLRLTNLIWNLFNQVFILKLQLLSLLTSADVNINEMACRYIIKTEEL